MRIVLDTGDLRQLAAEANRATQRVHGVRTAVQRERDSVQLNTRDDARLRRVSPEDDARRILAEMDRLEDDYRALSWSYGARARAVERAEQITWRPFLRSIDLGSMWRVPLRRSSPLGPNPFGGISDIGRSAVRFVGSARPGLPSIGRSGANALQRGFGFVRRGFNAVLKGFTDVAGMLIETAAGAWNRIWSRTRTLLQRVIGGIRDIVAFSGRVIVGATTTVVTTVGRFVSDTAKRPWHFLGRLWGGFTWGAGKLFTALDALEVISSIEKLMKIPAKLAEWAGHVGVFFKKIPNISPLVPMVIGGISAVVDFVKYGLGDARFWRSAFEAAAGVAILIASKAAVVAVVGGTAVTAAAAGTAAAVAAAGGLVLWGSMWFGGKLSDWFFMPMIRSQGEAEEREIDWETEKFLRGLPSKYNPYVGQDPVDVAPAPANVGATEGFLADADRSQADAVAAYDEWSNGPEWWTHYYGKSGESAYQCTAWANFRWAELGATGYVSKNGNQMAGEAGGSVDTSPKLGSMASSGARNHVMIVEGIEISSDGRRVLHVSEMNTGSDGSSWEDGAPEEFLNTATLLEQHDGTYLYRGNGREVSEGRVTFADHPGP